MLKFFRKIRQDLIAEGKTTKYLKYAIGEIILVVIGILIALQINNWNEGRKESNKERLLLSNLKVEFEDNLNNLDSIAGEVDEVIIALEKVFNHFGTGKPEISESSMDSLISKALISPNWRPSVYLLQNLSNSGSISDLKNDKLKLLLYNWSRLRNQMLEIDVRTEKTGEEIISYLKNNGSLRNIDVYSKEINYKKSSLAVNNLELLVDSKFENYIDDKLYMYITTKNTLKQARVLLVQLIEETKR